MLSKDLRRLFIKITVIYQLTSSLIPGLDSIQPTCEYSNLYSHYTQPALGLMIKPLTM